MSHDHDPPRLAAVDLSPTLSRHDGERELARLQRRLAALALQSGGQLRGGDAPADPERGSGRGPADEPAPIGPPLAVLFEGWDAAGKGGAIRRLAAALDPRHVAVNAFAAPTPRELAHHFLWRFAPALPGAGEIGVFDRTWYGRVLVERVEEYASDRQWQRAYEEIVGFERGLTMEGTVLVKLWLHISDAEQLRRFRAREDDPLKRYKLTDDDWRNRAKRPAYEAAVDEMLARTDRPHARWHVIAAESKPYARVAVLRTVIEALQDGLRAAGITPTDLDRESAEDG